jgi:hypothetical protein
LAGAIDVKKAAIEALQKRVTKDIEKATEPKGIEDLEKQITQLKADAAAHVGWQHRITIKQAEIKAWKESMPDVGEPDDEEIKRLDGLVRANEAELEKHRQFEIAIAAFDTAQARRRELEAIIDETNRMAELLKVGGEIRKKLAETGKKLPINEQLKEAWGFATLDVQPNGAIYFNNKYLTQASDSEQYRVAAVVGMAIAEIADIGFVVLDGIDVLDSQNQEALFKSLEVSRLNNIILLGTVIDTASNRFTDRIKGMKERAGKPLDWLRVYQTQTDNGTAVVQQVS